MSVNDKSEKPDDNFVIKHIKMISELYDAETFLNEKMINNQLKAKRLLALFDKDWLEQWKKIVGYEELKNKCKNAKNESSIKDEVLELFIKLDTKKKLEELGKMKCSKLKRPSTAKKSKQMVLDEKSDFIPILDDKCSYFSGSIDGKITVNAELSNGIIFFSNPVIEKNVDKKLILLYKENEKSNEFKRPIITLDSKEKTDDVIKKLKNKTIEEIINNKEYKIEIVKPEEIQNNKEEVLRNQKEIEDKKKEDERKKKEEQDRKNKILEEQKQKELEEQIKKQKELEEAKKQK